MSSLTSASTSAVLSDLSGDLEESRQVVALPAIQARTHVYDGKFKRAFLATLENPANKGLLTTYLFYDLPPIDSHRMFSSIGREAAIILSGGMAWERRIKEVGSSGYSGNDSSVIQTAIENQMLDLIPSGDLNLISYGGGDSCAFSGNEMQIIRSLTFSRPEANHQFCAVDILHRFALGCAAMVNTELGLKSEGVLGDFIYNGRLAIPVEAHKSPVIMIFGGPFENTPIIEGGVSPVDATALAWAKMNIQHGIGSTVIKTFDTNQAPDLKKGAYSPSKNFEAFLLSAFARAVQQGILEDSQYDIFANWRMSSTFNNASKSIELAVEVKKEHSVPVEGREILFRKGERRVITLSHKWDKEVHADIARRAGFDFEFFEEPGNFNVLMVAKAVRQPDGDLLALIPPAIK